MTRLANQILIDAPLEKVWAALADFGNVYKMSAGVIKSYSTSEKKTGLGAKRHCDLANFGAKVEEKIVKWEDKKSMTIDVYESTLPMVVNIIGDFKVIPKGDKTLFIGIFRYQMSNFFGNWMNALFMKRMNTKAWINFIAGLKHYVETGEEITKLTTLDTSKVELYMD